MIEEFETRTSFYPDSVAYQVIEEEYYKFEGDKDAFCEAFKKNLDGIAQRTQREANSRLWKLMQYNTDSFNELKAEVERLKVALEHEQEWQPYEMKENTSQADYDHLREHGRVMSDEEAKDLLYDWFGFAREKVRILRSVPTYEINRHHRLRKSGETERLPLYEATDWNYIRFDCGCMAYELYNDQIILFVQ